MLLPYCFVRHGCFAIWLAPNGLAGGHLAFFLTVVALRVWLWRGSLGTWFGDGILYGIDVGIE